MFGIDIVERFAQVLKVTVHAIKKIPRYEHRFRSYVIDLVDDIPKEILAKNVSYVHVRNMDDLLSVPTFVKSLDMDRRIHQSWVSRIPKAINARYERSENH